MSPSARLAPTREREGSVRVALACVYCRSDDAREALVFCGSCLSPHHPDCFADHGRCAVHGCGGKQTVAPGAPQRVDRAQAPSSLATPLCALAAAGFLFLALVFGLLFLIGGLSHARAEERWAAAEVALHDRLAEEHQLNQRLTAQVEDYSAWVQYGGFPTRVESLRLTGVYFKPTGRFAVFGHMAVPQGGMLYVECQPTRVWEVHSVQPDKVELRAGQEVLLVTLSASAQGAH
ncbi:MAG: hypothetical protein R3F62_05670 [Planctomycetota bacterium]